MEKSTKDCYSIWVEHDRLIALSGQIASSNTYLSSIVIEVIETVLFLCFYFFFYERYFKCKKFKQKHLSNMQPDIFISKTKHKQKHLSNIQPDIPISKKST